jgi:hypothetical protein
MPLESHPKRDHLVSAERREVRPGQPTGLLAIYNTIRFLRAANSNQSLRQFR